MWEFIRQNVAVLLFYITDVNVDFINFTFFVLFLDVKMKDLKVTNVRFHISAH